MNVTTSSGVDIQFAQSTYTFDEYDGTEEICASTVNDATYDFDVDMVIQVEDAESFPATGNSSTHLSFLCTFSQDNMWERKS